MPGDRVFNFNAPNVTFNDIHDNNNCTIITGRAQDISKDVENESTEEPSDDSVPQSIKPTDIPDDCSKAATDVFTKEMRLNNGVCVNSIAQCKKAIAQLTLTKPVDLAYLLAICKETKCVKPVTGATDFVRALIGIGSIRYTGQGEIKRLSDGMAHKELNPLHTQWSTKDRPIGDLLYQEILKSD